MPHSEERESEIYFVVVGGMSHREAYEDIGFVTCHYFHKPNWLSCKRLQRCLFLSSTHSHLHCNANKAPHYVAGPCSIVQGKYCTLGDSQLVVSQVCLGTMTFGKQNSEHEAHQLLDYAVDQGINFIDTAEVER